jgi:hypothetical protein
VAVAELPPPKVGSRTGAVRRRSGLSVAPRFLWECLTSPPVRPFPAPATSNGAGGFPALRSPVRFTPRLMRPAVAAALSATAPTPPGPPNSAFPLAYIPRLRSCRWRVLFSGHPCLPCCRKSYEQQGPLAPRALPRLNATTGPSATLSPSADFPVLPVIRPTQLPPFRVGTRRASPVARCILVVVPSLTTPPERPAASIGCGEPCCLRPHGCGLGLRICTNGATSRSQSLRPDNSRSPSRRGCRGASGLWFPSGPPSSYGASDSCPGRTDSCWTHQPFLDAQPDLHTFEASGSPVNHS